MNNDQLTEWDSSKATLMRIDETLKRASAYSFGGDLVSWYKELQVLKREAFVKMGKKNTTHKNCPTDVEKKEYCQRCHCAKLFSEVETDVMFYQRVRGRGDFTALKEKLDEAELFLRDFMDGKGMLMRDAKDAMTKFTGG